MRVAVPACAGGCGAPHRSQLKGNAMTDGDKVAAAILVAKACAPGTDIQGHLGAYYDLLDMMKTRENKKHKDHNKRK
jgi:hypothetical protein